MQSCSSELSCAVLCRALQVTWNPVGSLSALSDDTNGRFAPFCVKVAAHWYMVVANFTGSAPLRAQITLGEHAYGVNQGCILGVKLLVLT
jgi:hypothetical protein